MKKNTYQVIGVMSGTSLDGIDIAFIEFQHVAGKWSFNLIKAQTIPYSRYWRKELREAIGYSREKLERLDFKYTDTLTEEIGGFIRRNGIQTLDAICSHGHTIMHRPDKGWTYQIGNLPRLAKDLERTVVCDFRTRDVAFGGQGAPLVPIGDRMLFSEYDYCLNLGGFANISYEENNRRIAYDIAPVNIILNRYAQKLGGEYDDAGNFARMGTVDKTLLYKLNALPYYALNPPKSLGLEWVVKYVFPLLEASERSPKDILSTCTEHIAMQLAAQFPENANVLITGGGAYNTYLIERIKHHKVVDVVIPSSTLVDYKEALVFGLLGILRLRDEVNCLASVTGAQKDHVSGEIYYP